MELTEERTRRILKHSYPMGKKIEIDGDTFKVVGKNGDKIILQLIASTTIGTTIVDFDKKEEKFIDYRPSKSETTKRQP